MSEENIRLIEYYFMSPQFHVYRINSLLLDLEADGWNLLTTEQMEQLTNEIMSGVRVDMGAINGCPVPAGLLSEHLIKVSRESEKLREKKK